MTDDADTPPRMMQTGPHTFVQWDSAVRMGLREYAPEQDVRASLERAAEIVVEECPAGPDPRALARSVEPFPAPASVQPPRKPKHRVQPYKRPLSEILADSERNRVGPGPGRPLVHGG